ncbi:MAG: carbon monoxide dehydrogenase subunit G [Rhodobiaceae bacterium]|nr:carbon monoxide dehydrogenase subunit G [Rhodobiaceae bacterium]MCC0016929.1 carbon monoxide dehydrogenase subunit G [Rhodobiaceae bacterium]MCC0042068.1 carbon monoxide dehydrogenase subunit G [Rhodobiaceae bacterium]MCC0054167.1 carbon monoxide dehydrogenase subunit G [Rhodobiaceae bacterium]
MKMTGEYELPAARQAVWEALNDADVLKDCIPGCELFERDGENGFKATAVAKIGPVKAKFNGSVQLSDLDPPNGYRISGEGQGGVAGFAKGGADVRLADAEGGGTRLTYDVDAQIGGKIAQLGQRLVNGAAKKMADQFFENFRKKLSPDEA